MAKAKKKNNKKAVPNNQNSNGWLNIDPFRIRFQHSKIRPYFSGCGRSVMDTLDSIRKGDLRPEDIPPIQVIAGPDNWYFALNNRRLWVLKRCREEGLLKDGLIRVRVRKAKSDAESERYSIKNCATEAKFIREQDPVKAADVVKSTKKLSRQDQNENDVKNDANLSQDIMANIDDGAKEAKSSRSMNDDACVNSNACVDQDENGDSDGRSISDDESLQQYKNPYCLGGSSSDDSDSDSD